MRKNYNFDECTIKQLTFIKNILRIQYKNLAHDRRDVYWPSAIENLSETETLKTIIKEEYSLYIKMSTNLFKDILENPDKDKEFNDEIKSNIKEAYKEAGIEDYINHLDKFWPPKEDWPISKSEVTDEMIDEYIKNLLGK